METGQASYSSAERIPREANAMPTIELTDAEHAAVTAALWRLTAGDGFPRATRLEPLRSALAKLDPAAAALRRPLTLKNAKPAPQLKWLD